MNAKKDFTSIVYKQFQCILRDPTDSKRTDKVEIKENTGKEMNEERIFRI